MYDSSSSACYLNNLTHEQHGGGECIRSISNEVIDNNKTCQNNTLKQCRTLETKKKTEKTFLDSTGWFFCTLQACAKKFSLKCL